MRSQSGLMWHFMKDFLFQDNVWFLYFGSLPDWPGSRLCCRANPYQEGSSWKPYNSFLELRRPKNLQPAHFLSSFKASSESNPLTLESLDNLSASSKASMVPYWVGRFSRRRRNRPPLMIPAGISWRDFSKKGEKFTKNIRWKRTCLACWKTSF